MKSLFSVAKDCVDADNKYSKEFNIPQYTPSKEMPAVESLYDTEKYSKLLWQIKHSNVTDKEKAFLIFAAGRHIVFNYARIADYYAHSSAEMQRLMEQSALVILDIDDAIANGYVKLSKDIDKLLEDSGVPANE